MSVNATCASRLHHTSRWSLTRAEKRDRGHWMLRLLRLQTEGSASRYDFNLISRPCRDEVTHEPTLDQLNQAQVRGGEDGENEEIRGGQGHKTEQACQW